MKVRGFGRLLKAANGFLYHFSRYCRHSNWMDSASDVERRNYQAVKIYHSLEKSLSFSNRNPSSGWANAQALMRLVSAASNAKRFGFHDKAGLHVLQQFISESESGRPEIASTLKDQIEKLPARPSSSDGIAGGVKQLTDAEMRRGTLDSPEEFFLSRFTLREFKPQVVSDDIVQRAVSLTMKTPSVCNRQAWHIYHTSDPSVRDAVLTLQSGNRGFGDKIPNIFIVTADLKAFMQGEEHYQHWIDGGMLAMSLVYSLHSLGVASCCLNWSQTPARDKRLREIVNIRDSHSIIMMIGAGWPSDNNTVCVSPRRPVSEVFSNLVKN
ncbi:nitroreductase family protein [Zoogloea sp. LCSB751]|uniref:nitroreductase family protein n=1 Tax=Zoogloea sp. LCSB751 TaxID=1965277 RepID=UPI0009A5239A|nr:nitroreductase family protein [Zoogloea sp. LCSB751]